MELIVAPFIKRNALRWLLEKCEDTGNLKVVVRWSGSDIVEGVSDLEIYEDLKEKRIPLYFHPNIHLKLLVFNRNWAFHSSGNITSKGLGLGSKSNIEVGAQIRLETKDWIEINKLLEQANRIDDELYEQLCEYRDANRKKATLPPELKLNLPTDKQYSRFSLPAVQSPTELFKIYQNPEAYAEQEDLLSSFIHDIALYEIPNELNESRFFEILSKQFKQHPFIRDVVNYIQNQRSVRFGEMNGWITSKCSDKPTPYRWEVKPSTNKLYDWLAYFYPEITWSIPGKHSQVISWSAPQ